MSVMLFVVLIISVYGIRLCKNGCSNDMLAPRQTNMINGVFVMFVFMRHIRTYFLLDKFDYIFAVVDSHLGQLIVTSFLFYSGYGIMKSIETKKNYVEKLPRRFVRILIQFDMVVLCFWGLSFLIGNVYPLKQVLLSMIAYESIGNSNWYIFLVLNLYLYTYIAFRLFHHGHKPIIMIVALCIVYTIVLRYLQVGSWFYDTVFCFPAGMLFTQHENKILPIVFNNKKNYILVLFTAFILLGLSYIVPERIVVLDVRSLVFVTCVLLVSGKIYIGNKVLDLLGKHTFEIYILQRIPMIILAQIGLNKYMFIAIACFATLILALLYKKVLNILFSLPGICKIV